MEVLELEGNFNFCEEIPAKPVSYSSVYTMNPYNQSPAACDSQHGATLSVQETGATVLVSKHLNHALLGLTPLLHNHYRRMYLISNLHSYAQLMVLLIVYMVMLVNFVAACSRDVLVLHPFII